MSLAQLRRVRAALEFGKRFCKRDMILRGYLFSNALDNIEEAINIIQEEIDKLEGKP